LIVGVNYSALIYSPNFLQFARPVTFYPVTSAPAVGSFSTRGIFHDGRLDVVLEDGSLYVNQETSLDILETDFAIAGLPLPQQQDRVNIPQDGPGGMIAEGDFEIITVTRNGGGETNLILRAYSATPKP
jgi:hypothetical protein